MSNILALDTSTDACSAALLLEDQLLRRFKVEPRRHTHLLLPMVEELLAEAGVPLSRLDAIAFGRGPGSFAGIRIATGAAQGLALAADLPLVPVSTLAAMAAAAQVPPGACLLTALDARMDEVYWCAWQAGELEPVALMAEQVCAPAAMQLPAELSGAPCHALGSGWRYRAQMPAAIDARLVACDIEVYPDAAVMARLAQAALARGEAVAADEARPVYLRDQVAWKKKDQQ